MRMLASGCAGLLIVAAACQIRAAAPPPSESAAAAVGSRSVEDSVRSLEQAWADAVRTRDSASLERLVAPEFAVSGADATRPPVARAVWMENTLRRLQVDSIRLSPAHVTVRGDTAVATLRFVWAGRFMTAPPFRDSSELTDTWIRRAGEWQVHRRDLAK